MNDLDHLLLQPSSDKQHAFVCYQQDLALQPLTLFPTNSSTFLLYVIYGRPPKDVVYILYYCNTCQASGNPVIFQARVYQQQLFLKTTALYVQYYARRSWPTSILEDTNVLYSTSGTPNPKMMTPYDPQYGVWGRSIRASLINLSVQACQKPELHPKKHPNRTTRL